MELDRYRALVCAIETGSLSAAAERLQYTPSGISRMVAAPEAENGFSLLLRERNGVHPTNVCEKLLSSIRELLYAGESCAQLSAQLRGLDIGTVTVGTAFAEEPYIETYPDKDIDNARVFARCGVTPNLKFSTMDPLATYSMVEAGLGLSMNNAINGRAWSGSVRILPLDPPQSVEIGIASLPDLSPAARAFLSFLEAQPFLIQRR